MYLFIFMIKFNSLLYFLEKLVISLTKNYLYHKPTQVGR
jgi:hypothetical protein